MNYRTCRNPGILLLVTTAVPFSTLALDLPTLPASPIIPNRTVNLDAPADGVTDTTAAINSAIASLSNKGGGTLQFRSGTYLVKVNPRSRDYVLQIQSNVRLQGSSDGDTVIKVAHAQGPYNTLIGTCCSVHDVDIENITIDLNGQNNPIRTAAEKLAGVHDAIRIDQGPRVRVADCTALNVVDVNAFDFNGTVTDVEVANNKFPNVGQPHGSFDFDHSTIFAHAARVWIHGNSITAAYGPGTPDARTGIEIHGDDITVTNNTIDGYQIGVIITGHALSSNRQLYKNNIIKNNMFGMEIFSDYWPGQKTHYAIQNLTIEDNQISLSPFEWRLSGIIYSNEPSQGIFLMSSPSSPSAIDGLTITGNQVTFPTGGTPEWGDTFSGGVVLWTYNGLMIPISNLTISGNTVRDSLGAGIWTNVTLTRGTTITSNTIINSARSSESADSAGIYISGNTADMQIEKNTISDTKNPPRIKVGVSAVSTCLANCVAKDNTVGPGTITRSIIRSGWTH